MVSAAFMKRLLVRQAHRERSLYVSTYIVDAYNTAMANRKQASRTLRPDAARALAADLGWHSRMAGRLISAGLDAALAPAGLSSAQFGLLCLIASADDDTLGALAQRAGLNQSTMSRNLDMLAKSG